MTTMEYDYLIVTSLKLMTEDDKIADSTTKDKAKVHFDQYSPNGETALFLNTIVGTQTDGIWKYTANIVSLTEASRIAADGYDDKKKTTPLFCIHGHSDQIHEILPSIKRDEFDKANDYYPVPVIWPARKAILDYLLDRHSSKKAGDMFRKLGDRIRNNEDTNLFLHKSLMMHSMGNFLVHSNTSGGDVNGEHRLSLFFDNIFMVAADIPADIFSDSPRKRDDKKKAKIWKAMVSENGGKIFVFKNSDDMALIHSILPNWFVQRAFVKRLGLHGSKGNIGADFTDIVKDVNAKGYVDKTDTEFHHSYQYAEWTLQQYTDLLTVNDDNE